MDETVCTARDGVAAHPLATLTLSEPLSALMKERWITSVEEAVSCLAFDEGCPDRDVFLAQARDLLGDIRYGELTAPAGARSLGCVIEGFPADDGQDAEEGGDDR